MRVCRCQAPVCAAHEGRQARSIGPVPCNVLVDRSVLVEESIRLHLRSLLRSAHPPEVSRVKV